MYIIILFITLLSSLDLFSLGIYLGINNIKIKKLNILYINLFMALLLIITYFIKKIIIINFDAAILNNLSFIIFFILGISKIKDFFKKKENNYNIVNSFILILYLSIDNILMCLNLDFISNYFIYYLSIRIIIDFTYIYISNYFSFHFIKYNSNFNNIIMGLLFITLGFYNLLS